MAPHLSTRGQRVRRCAAPTVASRGQRCPAAVWPDRRCYVGVRGAALSGRATMVRSSGCCYADDRVTGAAPLNKRAYDRFCPLSLALDQVGDRWTLHIVYALLS